MCTSPSTKQLLQYIERIELPLSRLSKSTKQFFGRLCKTIHHSASDLPTYTMEDMAPIMDSFVKDFANSSIHHIPQNVFHDIQHMPKIGRKITLHIQNREIVIYMVIPSSSRFVNRTVDPFFKQCIRRIIMFLQIVLPLSECVKSLQCFLFLTNHLKQLPTPASGTQITTEHANTAFTYPCIRHSAIVIYRMEEWFKVFIHETFHTLGIDFSQLPEAETNKQLATLFRGCSPTMDFRIYEAYCEAWAEMINALYVAYLIELSRMNRLQSGGVFPHKSRVRFSKATTTKTRRVRSTLPISNIIRRFEHFMRNERIFSIIQMGKVLRNSRITYTDLYQGTLETPYNESTQIFSYYFIKPILLLHLNEFVDWCVQHNHSDSAVHSLFFRKTSENMREFVHFIQRFHKSPEQPIQQLAHTPLKGILQHTMRMSLYELL